MTNEKLTETQIIQPDADLLAELWADKRERRNTDSGLGMYIALNEGDFNLNSIISGVLSEMVQNPATAFSWSQDFGRVIVCVHPTKAGVFLRNTQDDGSKSFLKVETDVLLQTKEIVEDLAGGQNVIFLNNQPTTLEGLITSIVHMVDDTVWNKYLENEKRGIPTFKKALEDVLEQGITIETVDSADLLQLRKAIGKSFPLRLYGSKRIDSVPNVIGGTIFNPNLIKKSIAVENKITIPEQLPIREVKLEGSVGVFACITLAKKLHLGHLLLLAVSDLSRLGLGENDLTLINNDQGPRVQSMIAKLAQIENLSISQTVEMLKNKKFAVDKIVQAYVNRSRTEIIEDIDTVDILSIMEEYTQAVLIKAGFTNITVLSESEITKDLPIVNTALAKLGFSFLRTDKGIKILTKFGKSTAVSQGLLDIMQILTFKSGACFVDGLADTFDSVDAAQSLNLPVKQLNGAGAGIGNSIGSGTKSDLPTIEKMAATFGNNLAELARYFVLTQLQTSKGHPNSREVEPFYKFESLDDIFNRFAQIAGDLAVFKNKIRLTLTTLLNHVSNDDDDDDDDDAINTKYAFLPKQLESIKLGNANDFLNKFTIATVVAKNGSDTLSRRYNPYFSILIKSMQIAENDGLNIDNRNILIQIINLCLERIGINVN